ncbi:MAG TPA: 2TM domain-containing protein [Dehalococcoidia bacterium]|nr:2TM domain-containing protein [Dehalococcoidia bacterium]
MEAELVRTKAALRRTRRRARELHDFQAHLTAYLLINLALFLINVATPGSWWFYWPLLGWGAGVLVHAAHVYGLDRVGYDRPLGDRAPHA